MVIVLVIFCYCQIHCFYCLCWCWINTVDRILTFENVALSGNLKTLQHFQSGSSPIWVETLAFCKNSIYINFLMKKWNFLNIFISLVRNMISIECTIWGGKLSSVFFSYIHILIDQILHFYCVFNIVVLQMIPSQGYVFFLMVLVLERRVGEEANFLEGT